MSRLIYRSLVLIQHRKTRPCLTERLLMGRKESNQTIKTNNKGFRSLIMTLESKVKITYT